jgi:hypothetical protein
MKQTALLVVLLVLAGLGMASGTTLACTDGSCDGMLVYTEDMFSGTSAFHDQGIMTGENIKTSDITQMTNIGMSAQDLVDLKGCTYYFQDTSATWMKYFGPSTDPYMDITKTVQNSGNGEAFGTMQYSDKNTYWDTTNNKWVDSSVGLMSGIQTTKGIDYASLSSYYTNFDDQNTFATVEEWDHNFQGVAGVKFDRITQDLSVTPLQFSVDTKPFDPPTWYTNSFPLST